MGRHTGVSGPHASKGRLRGGGIEVSAVREVATTQYTTSTPSLVKHDFSPLLTMIAIPIACKIGAAARAVHTQHVQLSLGLLHTVMGVMNAGLEFVMLIYTVPTQPADYSLPGRDACKAPFPLAPSLASWFSMESLVSAGLDATSVPGMLTRLFTSPDRPESAGCTI